jgi:DNA-directed RNA polymerase specialized sigma24 family protein
VQDEPDRELLRRFTHGDREAFEALFRQFEREVSRWILRIVREPAATEDALIETFWRAYRVADALGVPIGTVKSRLLRATRGLRAELTRLGIHT